MSIALKLISEEPNIDTRDMLELIAVRAYPFVGYSADFIDAAWSLDDCEESGLFIVLSDHGSFTIIERTWDIADDNLFNPDDNILETNVTIESKIPFGFTLQS
tara:strand:+ start:310 stop:618 length:309 start_codon:yes stop_codon:yes gene_type:complete